MSACDSKDSVYESNQHELETENAKLKAENEKLQSELADKVENDITVSETTENSDATEEPTIESQKDFFTSQVKPKVDEIIEEYNLIWDSLCAKSFTGISNGSMDLTKAYENFKVASVRYNRLYDQLSVPDKGLSNEYKKKVGSFSVDAEDSVGMRIEAINKTMKMIDNQTFKPSEISNIQEIVNGSTDLMKEGIVSIVEIQHGLVINK